MVKIPSNTLKPITLATNKPTANLEYFSVRNKEYPGVSVSVPQTTPDNDGAVASIPVIEADVRAYGAVTEVVKVSPTKGQPEGTIGPAETYELDAVSGIFGVLDDKPVAPTDLALMFEQARTKVKDDTPVKEREEPLGKHYHTADQVDETKARLWLTPDERVRIRELSLLAYGLQGAAIQKTMVFVVPEEPETGPYGVELRFPWVAIGREIQLNCRRPGTSDTVLVVETCKRVDYANTPDWKPFVDPITFPADTKYLTIPINKSIGKDDMFRVKFNTVGSPLHYLTIEIVTELTFQV